MAVDNIGLALKTVLQKINEVAEKRPENLQKLVPRLVAVSKTKPIECIIEAYNNGQRHFGENYVQELVGKSNDPRLRNLVGLRWHFIGHLQRNKCNNLVGVPNLYMVETVDSEKLAATLNNSWGKFPNREPLKVMVEVNTSEEKSKKGCLPAEATQLTEFVFNECPHLRLSGLMTIGQYNYDWEKHGPNPDFLRLIRCREEICGKLNLPLERFELSMGMSSDYEKAITMGSTNVRVGSTIFGVREPKLPAKASNPPTTSAESSGKEVDEKKPNQNGTTDMLQENKDFVNQFSALDVCI
ncbi:predicted protein [Nematostella vectensis]|uniref:Pyridoxal phosphate homeostasis protein n=2 Tax=Nematostella vectensis TaxID=45351 RepID=A7RIJ0_NEMVE|nr:predicted protein [Nematostella vectensis]|eukprot:XP_001640781.1 predicted protein [Nematostella vectensis]